LDTAVAGMNMASAPGPDGYTPTIAKTLFSFRPFFLFFLSFVNFCFLAAWVPFSWLCSEIFVLYKGKGDPILADSFRGIALCSMFGKVYERLLLSRLARWWRNSTLFFLPQFGFRSGSSTLDAVFVLRSIVQCVCRFHRLPLHAAFIDLKKAFPSVSHPMLFSHLTRLGVPRPLVAAIRAFYVFNRSRLRVGNYLSQFFVVTLGLLEGSILSPLLFSILVSFVWEVVNPSAFPGDNNFVFRIDDVWVLAFADDLVILSPSREKLAAVLAKLDREFTSFNLVMNLSKTEVMTFVPRGRPAGNPESGIVIRSHTLAKVAVFRYLGVVLSRTGSLATHVSSVAQRARVAAISTTTLVCDLNICDLSRMRCYFNAFVRAQWYGLDLLPYSSHLLDLIQSSRNLYLRRIFRLPPSTASDLFYLLFPSYHPALICLRQRHTFFRRALRHDLQCVWDSFVFDANFLLNRCCGWFYDSFCFY
jgi:hypothetical protein